MRACNTILLILFLAFGASAFAQEDAQTSIGTIEPMFNAGTATRAQQLDLARAYMSVGRYYEARKVADRMLILDANDADATAIRDQSKEKLRGMAMQRVADAEIAAKRDDATDADRTELANAYFAAAEYRKAADLYAKLPDSAMTPELRRSHARSLAWSSQHDAAERAYAKMLAESPSPELELEYGRVLSWMGANQAAHKRLQSVYETTRTEEAAIALANSRAWSGDREGAITLLSEFTTANTNAHEARALLEQIRMSPELKIERIDNQIETDPYNLALRAERARLLYDAGRYSEALKTIEFIREHPPEAGEVSMTSSTGESLIALEREIRDRRKQRVEELDARMREMNIHDPGIDADVLAMAKAYTGLGAYPQAIRLYEAYLQNVPDDRQARTNYARVLSWDRRYDAAQAQYERLLREDPERADIRLEYAQAMSYDSEFVPAIRELRGLTDLSNNSRGYLYTSVPTQAHYNLGQIYRWYGWREEAATHQNRALELDSTFLPARDELFRARSGRPTSSLDARYTYATNSNDFTLKRADLEGEHWLNQRMAVEASVGRHNFEHRGTDVNANAASVGALYRQTDQLMLRGRVGGTFYEEDLGTRPYWSVGASYLPNIQSRAAIDYNHYDLIYDVFTLQSLTPGGGVGTNPADPISIDDVRAHYDWTSGGFWSFLADASYGFVSDDNRRAGAHGLVSFRLWNRPFIAVKADGRMLSYDFRTNRYWSPEEYRSLAAVLQIGQNVRDRFYWNIEGKAGKSWEGSRNSDLRAIAASVTVPVTDLLDVVGSYNYGKSGRFESILGDSGEFVNYWQRSWYVGVRVKRLYAGDDQRGRNPYYFDNRPLTDSAVIPPEVH
jgi:tetratricopeptide (TPR) repeat protein